MNQMIVGVDPTWSDTIKNQLGKKKVFESFVGLKFL